VSDITTRYSFNFGILGTTIGGGETYGSWEYLPEEAWPRTRSIADAPDEAQELTLTFDHGLPVALAGLREGEGEGEGDEGDYHILEQLNRTGAEHGVGRGIHTGQTIMGITGGSASRRRG